MSQPRKRRFQEGEPSPAHSDMLQGKPKPKDVLPEQKPLTQDEFVPKEPPKWVKVCKKVFFWLFLVMAVIAVFVLLLIAEPKEDDKDLPSETAQEAIRMPMTALESAGDTDIARLTDTFGGELLTLSAQGITLERAKVYDTAFQGNYARRAEMTYAYNGQIIKAVSIRPATAAELLKDGAYTLCVSSLYELGGRKAARMQSSETICVFADADNSAVALFVPLSLESELSTLLAQTTLHHPTATQP